MKLSRIEQETIILFNEAGNNAEIETYNSRMKRRLEQLCKDRPEEIQLVKQNNESSTVYSFPKSWIKINPKRIPSEAQKKHLEEMRSKL